MEVVYSKSISKKLVICLYLLACIACSSKASNEVVDKKGSPKAEKEIPTLKDVSSSLPRQSASTLFFIDEKYGWVLSKGNLYRTSNGGHTWNVIQNELTVNASRVDFVDTLHGWMIIDEWSTIKRSNSIFGTHDGGMTWQKMLEVPTPIYTIDFINEKTGYAIPRWQPILYTMDGGKTWENLEQREELTGVFFLTSEKAWAYGNGIWRTNDGRTWIEVIDNTVGELYASCFFDDSHGWIVGSDHQIWRMVTEQNWQRVQNVPKIKGNPEIGFKEPPIRFYDVNFVTFKRGWVASQDGSILHSTDGGVSWKVISKWSKGIKQIKFINEQEGFALDEEENLLYTEDEGKKWKKIYFK